MAKHRLRGESVRFCKRSKTVTIYQQRALAIEVETEMAFVRRAVGTESATRASRETPKRKRYIEKR
jgi:hypothetical protein